MIKIINCLIEASRIKKIHVYPLLTMNHREKQKKTNKNDKQYDTVTVYLLKWLVS